MWTNTHHSLHSLTPLFSADEGLALELAKKVEGLISLKDEIDAKMAGLPTMADIQNIHESYVTWIGRFLFLQSFRYHGNGTHFVKFC